MQCGLETEAHFGPHVFHVLIWCSSGAYWYSAWALHKIYPQSAISILFWVERRRGIWRFWLPMSFTVEESMSWIQYLVLCFRFHPYLVVGLEVGIVVILSVLFDINKFNNPHWLSHSFRPLKPPISWSQMDRLWRTAGVSTLCTLSRETKRVGFWHNWGLPKTPVGCWCWWVHGIYMGSMMIILPFKNSGGYRMWDVFVGQGSEGSKFTTVRCTFVVWYILGWPHKQETLLWNWWQRGCEKSWDRQTTYDTTSRSSWLGYLDSLFFLWSVAWSQDPKSAPSCRLQDVLLIFLPDWQGWAGYDYLLLRFGPAPEKKSTWVWLRSRTGIWYPLAN